MNNITCADIIHPYAVFFKFVHKLPSSQVIYIRTQWQTLSNESQIINLDKIHPTFWFRGV